MTTVRPDTSSTGRTNNNCFIVLILLLLVSVISSTTAAVDDEGTKSAPSASASSCGLYLAQSHAQRSEETMWGIYAGRSYRSGEALGSPEVAILLPGIKKYTTATTTTKSLGGYLQGLAWSTETVAAQFATNDDVVGKSVALLPGFGLFAGCYMKKRNTKWNVTNPYHAAAVATSQNDPFSESSFFNIQAVATNDIELGSELFMGCGGDDDDEEADDKDALTTKEYAQIDVAVAHMMDFFANHQDHLNDQSRQLIYDFFKQDVLMKSAVANNNDPKAIQIDRLFPTNVDDLANIPKAGGAMRYHDPNRYPDETWLNKNGLCLDHIVVDESTTISGRGVLARRDLAKDSTIAPVPLIHLPNRAVFDIMIPMNNVSTDTNSDDHQQQKQHQKQLMLNYCYAHESSSAIFCPAGSAVMALNHSPTPNARLIWSNWTPEQVFTTTNLWKSKQYKEKIILMMELIALEDIPAGMEVTIDYGRSWERAYQDYMSNHRTDGIMMDQQVPRANQLNGHAMLSTDMVFPNSNNNNTVVLKVFISKSQRIEIHDTIVAATTELQDNDDKEDRVISVEWKPSNALKHKNLVNVRVILAVDQVHDEYTVELLQTDPMITIPPSSTRRNIHIQLTKVPREALVFVDAPMMGGQFHPKGFRHPIGFPDELFPAAWRDLEDVTASSQPV